MPTPFNAQDIGSGHLRRVKSIFAGTKGKRYQAVKFSTEVGSQNEKLVIFQDFDG